jgi:hypothetical protein
MGLYMVVACTSGDVEILYSEDTRRLLDGMKQRRALPKGTFGSGVAARAQARQLGSPDARMVNLDVIAMMRGKA